MNRSSPSMDRRAPKEPRPWKPGVALQALLYWTAVTTLVFWLPFVRGFFDGPSYAWAFAGGLRGRGVGGDFWFPAIGVAYALAMLYLGWRGARLPFHWLLLAWHLFLAGGATTLAVRAEPGELTFQGESLGIEVDLAVAGPVLFGVFALLALGWSWRDLRSGRSRKAPAWLPANLRFVGLLAALLPVQFVLLRFGEPHGTSDAVGVLLTIAQWLLLGAALKPRGPRERKAHLVGSGGEIE